MVSFGFIGTHRDSLGIKSGVMRIVWNRVRNCQDFLEFAWICRDSLGIKLRVIGNHQDSLEFVGIHRNL